MLNSEKKKLFEEFSKKRDGNATVFQYQTFHYGGCSNIGMSDPEYKWKNILKLDALPFRGKSVLDIGCNVGEMLRISKDVGTKRAVGIESMKLMYDGAVFLQKNFRKKKIDFIHGEFMKYKFNEKFDYIFAFAVLYYMYPEYSFNSIIKKIREICNYSFIGEITYKGKVNRSVVETTLKKYFSKVECIGLSIRTKPGDNTPWKNKAKSKTREVWHCFV